MRKKVIRTRLIPLSEHNAYAYREKQYNTRSRVCIIYADNRGYANITLPIFETLDVIVHGRVMDFRDTILREAIHLTEGLRYDYLGHLQGFDLTTDRLPILTEREPVLRELYCERGIQALLNTYSTATSIFTISEFNKQIKTRLKQSVIAAEIYQYDGLRPAVLHLLRMHINNIRGCADTYTDVELEHIIHKLQRLSDNANLFSELEKDLGVKTLAK